MSIKRKRCTNRYRFAHIYKSTQNQFPIAHSVQPTLRGRLPQSGQARPPGQAPAENTSNSWDSPVPLQPVVVVSVEEVRLRSHGPDVGMHAEELEQCARASLLHADDDGLGQLLAARAVRET